MTHAGDFIDVYDVVDGEFQKIGRGLVVASGRREEMSIPVVDIQFGGEMISRPVADVKLAGRVEQLEQVLKEVDEWADFMGGFDIQKKIKMALGEVDQKSDDPVTRTVPRFKSIRANQVKGRGTIITVDLAVDRGTEAKKLERLVRARAADPNIGDVHVEIDGVECILVGIERNSANSLAGLTVKELEDGQEQGEEDR